VTFESPHCLYHCNTPSGSPAHSIPIRPPHRHSGIAMGCATSFFRTRKYEMLKVYSASVADIDNALGGSAPDLEALRKLVPSEYHDYLPLFKEAQSNKLLPQRLYDYQIQLIDNYTPLFCRNTLAFPNMAPQIPLT
jgi:hypothetical protein